MTRLRANIVVACAVAAVAVVVVGACDATVQSITCYDIPAGGCPVQGGVECEDPTCAAAYNCLPDGGWQLAYACPAHDAAAVDVANEPVSDAGFDIDAPPGAFGGPGCVELEMPDCPLGEALICGAACCGCQDLYICDDGGWDFWGECTDAGPTAE
jgi:hypothetical protein